MVGLVKIQKRCQKWILHAKISRKSGITQLSMSICFQVTFPKWPAAAILDFGFSQIPPPFSRGSWGLNFFLNTSKSSNQVSNLNMLSVVTGPPDCTQLLWNIPTFCISTDVHVTVHSQYCTSNFIQRTQQR